MKSNLFEILASSTGCLLVNLCWRSTMPQSQFILLQGFLWICWRQRLGLDQDL